MLVTRKPITYAKTNPPRNQSAVDRQIVIIKLSMIMQMPTTLQILIIILLMTQSLCTVMIARYLRAPSSVGKITKC